MSDHSHHHHHSHNQPEPFSLINILAKISAIVITLVIIFSISKIIEPRLNEVLINNQTDSAGFVIATVNEVTPLDLDQFIEGLVYNISVQLASGEIIDIEYSIPTMAVDQIPNQGEQVILAKFNTPDGLQYYISDRFRLPTLFILCLLFVIFVVALTGWKGVYAMIGLGLSVLLLFANYLPALLLFGNPVLLSFIVGLFTLSLTLFLTQGWSKFTMLSILSGAATLALAFWISSLSVTAMRLSGQASEEAYQLQYVQSGVNLAFQGILLGSIVLGTIGILDDVITTQVATVEEISKDSTKSFRQVFSQSMNVGRAHILALVNTLAIAYLSAGLPVFLSYILTRIAPWWVILNSELVSEELVRTIIGSMTLCMAVPISTALASWYYTKQHRSNHDNHSSVIDVTNESVS
jgi:uncharacterized membrane protein